MEKGALSGKWDRVGAITPGNARGWGSAAAFFALYVALDWLTYVFPARFGITPFNPEAAVAVALLIFCGVKTLPLVFIAALWGEYALPAVARPVAVMVINSAILSAGYLAIALLLTRRFRIRIELDTQRDVLRLMGITLVCMLVCGVAYVGVLVSYGIGPTDRAFNGARRFFIGYSVGVLVAAPLLFMAFSAQRRAQLAALVRAREAWLLLAVIAVCVWWVFLQDRKDHVSNFYLFFLPLIWAAVRFGMVGAASVLVLIQAGLFLMVYWSGYQPVSVFELQLLLITLAITGLLLGVSIDEQRRAAQDFRESLKLAAAGEMAAAITHEINQPLTALSGYATAVQLMAGAPTLDRAQLTATMRKLVEESKRTAAVVRRLRDFFRAGATRLERVALPDIAARVVASLRTQADAAHVTLTSETHAEVTPVLVDAVQMEVVLRNLLLNAMDSVASRGNPDNDGNSGNGGNARVSIRIEINAASLLQVTVRDSGPGFRAADAERLFESFVTTKTSGMGMGLAISRAIIDAHGGRLWAVPGDSGVLCFTLPRDIPSSAG